MNSPKDPNAHLIHFAAKPDVVFSKGRGMTLIDQEGKEYLDMCASWACNTLGHSPPSLADALHQQAKQLISCGPGFYNRFAIELATAMSEISGMDKWFFCSTGAEANENATKLAKKYGEKKKDGANEIICMNNGFHGRTYAMMSATGKPEWKKIFRPHYESFLHCPFNDLEALKEISSKKTVAVMLELIQGEGGVNFADELFLSKLSIFCKQNNILLIIDEVQTGMGRTGKWFCFQHHQIKPDILTVGKGLGGGYPLAGIGTRKSLDLFDTGDIGGTFNGQALGCSVGLKVIDEIKKNSLLENSLTMGKHILNELKKVSKQLPIDNIRGEGLMIGFDVSTDSKKLVSKCLENGLIINSPKPNTIRIIPSLNISYADIEKFLSIFVDTYKKTLAEKHLPKI